MQAHKEREEIGEIEGVKIIAIDKEAISRVHPEWQRYLGSHHWGKGTSYIPQDEIWIAQGLTPEEFVRLVNHESIERLAMRDLQAQGLSPEESWHIAHPTVKSMGF